MQSFGPGTYGERNADVYDEWHAAHDPADAVRGLADLLEEGPAGPVFELAVGTGRVTIPLAELDVDLRGVDASEAMVARMRAKPGGDRIPVVIGDMADVDDGTDDLFAMVFVVFSTFFFLQDQEEQVRCFANAAKRLLPGGRFVLGIGSSSPAIVERWNGVPFHEPFKRTRDTLRFLKAALAGEKVSEEYETFTVRGFKLERAPEHRDLVAASVPAITHARAEIGQRAAAELGALVKEEVDLAAVGRVGTRLEPFFSDDVQAVGAHHPRGGARVVQDAAAELHPARGAVDAAAIVGAAHQLARLRPVHDGVIIEQLVHDIDVALIDAVDQPADDRLVVFGV